MISIIIPVYNGERHIKNIVKTLLAQSEKDFKVIFVDDGSTDGTAEKLDALKAYAPFRMVVQHQPNRGVSAARNAGIRLAKGASVCFVDVDDCLSNDYLLHLKNAMEKTGCRVVMGHITRNMDDLSAVHTGAVKALDNAAFCKEFLYRGNKYSICAAIFDAQVFSDYDLFFGKIIATARMSTFFGGFLPERVKSLCLSSQFIIMITIRYPPWPK